MTNDTERTARFNELAEAYSTDLYRYGMWICGNDALAKDLVQETFLIFRVLRNEFMFSRKKLAYLK